MPSYLRILRVDPAGAAVPGPEDDTHTWTTLQEALEDAAGGEARLLVQGEEYFDVSVWHVRRGTVEQHPVGLATSPGATAPLELTPAPEVPLALSGEADEVIDSISDASAGEGGIDDDGRLVLPFDWSCGVAAVLDAVAAFAARVKGRNEMFLSTADGYFQLVINPKELVSLHPLWPCSEDAAAAALARSVLAPRVTETTARPPTRAPKAAIPKRRAELPFTTGSKTARLDSISSARWGDAATPVPLPLVIAAMADAANQAPMFAAVRSALYELAVAKGGPEGLEATLARLPNEAEACRSEIYAAISNVADPRAYAALTAGFKNDPSPEVSSRIRAVIWRQRGAVERLVRGELVPSWEKDPAWCGRILHVINTEYLEIPRAWVADAPATLHKALGPQLRD